MAKFDLIAFDLDGTVFPEPSAKIIRPRVVAALQAAHDAGVITAVASGRTVGMLGPTLTGAPWVDWLITVNGACVSPAHGGDAVSERMMPREQVRAVVSCIRSVAPGAGDNGWSLFAPGHACFDRGLNERFRERLPEGPERESFSFVESVLAEGGKVEEIDGIDTILGELTTDIYKIGCMLDTVELFDATCRELTASAHTGGLELASVGPTELEITKAGVNKGSALGILCRHLGIDEHRAVAFGDSGNDATFADSACTFVAMGNATPEIKAVADDICPSVKQDGVAVWLEDHLGLV